MVGEKEQTVRTRVNVGFVWILAISHFAGLGMGVILSLFGTGCGSGGDRSISTPPRVSKLPKPTVLRTLYRVVNGADRMTSFGADERSVYPVEGQLYYVPDSQGTGQNILNRMVNSDGTDHADAVEALNGYSIDEVLGYPWSTPSPRAVAQMLEGFNSGTGDYAMLIPGENLEGYTVQRLPSYGYPRYGSSGEVMLSLTAGGVEVESNAVAGGVLWRWTWNGMEFVNNADYGREIQAAFYYPPTSEIYNPNEAGDYFPRADPATAHGSPVLRLENQGNTQITRTVPLNWDAPSFGGDADHPVIWDQIVLGKDLTLNYANLGAVAKYTTHLVLPAATGGGIAAPAIYLRANFTRFWTYDATSKTLQEVTTQVPNGCHSSESFFFHPAFGGTIASDATGMFAMGVYSVDVAHGGATTFIALQIYPCSGDGTAESAGDTVVMNPVRGGGDGVNPNATFPAGESTYTVYLITDTVQNVAAQMDRLYGMGAK